MRPLPLLAAAITLAIAPIAHADTYTYTFYGQNVEPGFPSTQYDFERFTIDPSIQVPYTIGGLDSPDPPCDAPNCFSSLELNGDGTRQFMRNGGIENNNSDLSYDVEYLYLHSSSTSAQLLSPFTGPIDDPTILTGNLFADAYFPYLSFQADGPITIVDNTLEASAVPEPSTLALLGTGALGLITTSCRRLRA